MKSNLCKLCAVMLAVVLLLCPFSVSAAAAQNQKTAPAGMTALPAELIPGGYSFGVKFTTRGVMVVGFRDIAGADGSQNPARQAGVRLRDVIVAVNTVAVENAQALSDCVSACDGKPLTLTCLRREEEITLTVTPQKDESGAWRTGLYVRDSGAGIGTVTYIDPETHRFGGLGHGICDVDTGELMPLRRGNVVRVTLSGIKRGEAGSPGELRGYFHTDKIGTLRQNTACGVFGVLSTLPDGAAETVPTASKQEIHVGEAQILCTLTSGERCAYAVTLSAIDREATGSKCFSIHVTDPHLIEQTGGIVQGMSGSPVLQDGRLVGAVTHVLVNDPTKGYGIFIENMLRAAS